MQELFIREELGFAPESKKNKNQQKQTHSKYIPEFWRIHQCEKDPNAKPSNQQIANNV